MTQKNIGSSGINGTKIFVYYCDRVLGHRYLLWLEIFTVLFLPLDPTILLLASLFVCMYMYMYDAIKLCTHGKF